MMFAALWQNLRQVHGSFAPDPKTQKNFNYLTLERALIVGSLLLPEGLSTAIL
jgi:hypothetical protein